MPLKTEKDGPEGPTKKKQKQTGSDQHQAEKEDTLPILPIIKKDMSKKPHTKKGLEEKEEAAVPRISFDYFFFSEEEEAANKNPILVMVDESTDEKYARGVEHKGLGEDGELEWVVTDMLKELKSWGYHGGESGHVIFKSDGEAPIKAVRDRLARKIGGEEW